jgi:erythronate-4-phosphate dehydrogenase
MPSEPFSILVDENVPYALESFGRLGRVRALPGRRITAADLEDAGVLIVRSVTRVDAALLGGSRVRFVGTATIGCDHVDLEYLRAQDIEFASAPGSNAISVAEYVMAALLESAHVRGATLEGATLAIVGVGNVGSSVAQRAAALGMRCLRNDPPRRRAGADPAYVDLADALPQADYVTLHVPLTREGPDATLDLAGPAFFQAMRPDAVFLNTSRGAVVDEAALAAAIESGRVSHTVLDVWRGEPAIDGKMVGRAFLATPHIAGYSFDGKVAATTMLYRAACRWLGRPDDLDLSPLLPPASVPHLDLTTSTGSDEEILRRALAAVYDIGEDDRALRQTLSAASPATEFDRLRKEYKRRRELRYTGLSLDPKRAALARKAAGLGFTVV